MRHAHPDQLGLVAMLDRLHVILQMRDQQRNQRRVVVQAEVKLGLRPVLAESLELQPVERDPQHVLDRLGQVAAQLALGNVTGGACAAGLAAAISSLPWAVIRIVGTNGNRASTARPPVPGRPFRAFAGR